MSNTFEDILNASVVYIFTGNRIIEKNVLQFTRVDSKTIFTRIEDMGIVIFEDGQPRVKKGEVVISLSKSAFDSEVLLSLKNKIDKLRQEVTNHRQKIHSERQQISVCQERINRSLNYIGSLQTQVQQIKDKIDKEYSNVSQT
jgi:predicted transcriptional regulator